MFAATGPSPNARTRAQGLAVDGVVDVVDWLSLRLDRGMAGSSWPWADFVLRSLRCRTRPGKMGSKEYAAGTQRTSWRQHIILS